jgi:hypothetical protein
MSIVVSEPFFFISPKGIGQIPSFLQELIKAFEGFRVDAYQVVVMPIYTDCRQDVSEEV